VLLRSSGWNQLEEDLLWGLSNISKMRMRHICMEEDKDRFAMTFEGYDIDKRS
jgi:hypothetical protein